MLEQTSHASTSRGSVTRQTAVHLDEVDLHLLDLLRRDGRMSVNALAGAAGISRANAYRRLDRLQDEGVIRGFTVQIDHTRAGLPLSALILISVEQQRWAAVKDALSELTADGIDYLAATTGEFDFLARFRIPDIAAVRDAVLRNVHAIPGVTSTRTVFVLDEVVHP